MTVNPFAIQEQEQIQDRFALMVFSYHEPKDKNGNPFYQCIVQYAAIGGNNGSDVKTVKYGNFNHPARSKEMGNSTPKDTALFLKSLLKHFPNPIELTKKTDGVYVRYHWHDWEDTDPKTIKWHEDNDKSEKIQLNDKGKLCVVKGAFYIDEVYPDEATALAAHDSIWGIESSESDINSAFSVANDTAVAAPTAVPVADKETASKFLPWIIKTAMNGGNKVDRDVLATMIAGNDALRQHFTVDSPEVVAEIAKLETEPAF